ncbi:MAG: ROK family protein [Fibrobacterota bacterium]
MIVPINARDFRRQAPRIHRHNMVEMARRHPGVTRQEIAGKLGISLSLVNTYAASLFEAGWLQVREKRGRKSAGRKSEALSVRGDKTLLLCVWVHALGMSATRFDFAGTEQGRMDRAWTFPSNQAEFLSMLTSSLTALAEWAAKPRRACQIALCLDGSVVSDYSMVFEVHGIPQWAPLSLDNILKRIFKHPPSVVSRTTVLLNQYCIGHSRPDFMLLKLEGAVGMGVVRANETFRGSIGSAGPLSHLSLDPKGPRCLCGSHGCLEAISDPGQRWEHVRPFWTKLAREYKAKHTVVVAGLPDRKQGPLEFWRPDNQEIMQGIFHYAAQKAIESGV